MKRKLIKYELMATARLYLPLFLVMAVSALLGRLSLWQMPWVVVSEPQRFSVGASIGRSDAMGQLLGTLATFVIFFYILVMSRQADLYLLDEPIGGVDPAARDFILSAIIGNYREDATVLLSTHLIRDVEQVLDEVIFMRYGHLVLYTSVDNIREQHGKSVDAYFREVFAC